LAREAAPAGPLVVAYWGSVAAGPARPRGHL